MESLKRKKLLILGGNALSCDIVETAKHMGAYTIVTDWNDAKHSPAKLIADEYWDISIMDYDALSKKIKECNVDGVFTSFTDSYLLPYQHLCEMNDLSYYASREAFEKAVDKDKFKKMCKEYGVPTVPEYDIDTFDPTILSKENAVIIKPVDNSGARGITYCDNAKDYPKALENALSYSPSKHIIIEKFIRNGGTSMSVRYIAVDGDIFLQAVGDRYVLDDTDGKALITAAAFYPSKHTDEYIKTLDEKVKTMFRGVGVKNGALFMESFWTPEGIYFYEMGLRLSGGQTYKMTEIATGANELRMMVRYALTGKMCDEEEKKRINAKMNGCSLGSMTVLLRQGVIAEIKGIEDIENLSAVYAVSWKLKVGDEIKKEHIGTLFQLLCRISIVTKDQNELRETIRFIIDHLSVMSTEGEEMFIKTKLQEIYDDYAKREA